MILLETTLTPGNEFQTCHLSRTRFAGELSVFVGVPSLGGASAQAFKLFSGGLFQWLEPAKKPNDKRGRWTTKNASRKAQSYGWRINSEKKLDHSAAERQRRFTKVSK